MNRLKVLGLALAVFLSLSLQAQIFINTGNPDLNNYVKQDSNAVIWDGGKDIPLPKNVPHEAPAAKSKAAPATKTVTATIQDPAVKKNVAAKANTDKTNTEDLNSINHPSAAHAAKAGQPKAQPAAKTATVKSSDKTNASNPVIKEKQEPKAGYVASNKDLPISDYPADAVVGKCYARCQAPDIFELKEEVVVDKPASVKTEVIPATYETVMETVVLVPEGKRIITIPAQYETQTENKMVSPPTQKWVKTGTSKNCLSANPKDCEIWTLKQFDAVYQKVSKKVEVVPQSVQEEVIPAQTQVVPRQKIVQPSREVKTEIPTTYKTIMKKVLVKRGGYMIWKETLCDQDITESKINQIQQALAREGYDPGSVDNQMGEKTKESIIKFQRDKGLPVGNLNLETLHALGVQ